MTLYSLTSIGLPILMGTGGILAYFLSGKKKAAMYCGCFSAIAGVIAGIPTLLNQSTEIIFYQIPILLLTVAGALHSTGYLKDHGDERAGYYWLFFNLTAAAMWYVTIASAPISFLIAWEVMGLASFALVAFDSEQESISQAAWVYLLACQAGALFLIMMFFLPISPSAKFQLGVIGFGLKIGFPLLHVWLPEAHPAAPAPVSALMSGAMIQLGFYGLFKWTYWNSFESGCTLLILGLIAALWGIMMALPQKNLKKLLAYSSVENMGILSIGFGFSIIAQAKGCTVQAQCAVCGTFLHMLNHACLKGGLFLGAGSVLKGCHTLDIDQMGGLLKRMPKSGSLFVLNACSLSGLPPFNGFLSEFLIYLAGIYGIMSGNAEMIFLGGIMLVILSLTGGLAAAVYAKAIGGTFLGEPRTKLSMDAKEISQIMRIATGMLFICSILLVILSPWIIGNWMIQDSAVFSILQKVVEICIIISVIFSLIAAIHFGKRDKCRKSITWDCGYIQPSARMEYTGSAFSQPLADFFAPFINFRKKMVKIVQLFPKDMKFESSANDPLLCGVWKNIFQWTRCLAEKVHMLQSGSLHLYILIMTIALILLLLWGLLLPWGGKLIQGGF